MLDKRFSGLLTVDTMFYGFFDPETLNLFEYEGEIGLDVDAIHGISYYHRHGKDIFVVRVDNDGVKPQKFCEECDSCTCFVIDERTYDLILELIA